MQTEAAYDTLTIFDGRQDTSPILEEISGNIGSFTIKSNGSSLLLKFESDNEFNNLGFFATVHYGKKIVTKRLYAFQLLLYF